MCYISSHNDIPNSKVRNSKEKKAKRIDGDCDCDYDLQTNGMIRITMDLIDIDI